MAQSERRAKVVKLEPGLRFSRVAPGVAKAKLRDETRRVLIALGIFVNANGQCWPGNSLLSAERRVERRHLWRALGEA